MKFRIIQQYFNKIRKWKHVWCLFSGSNGETSSLASQRTSTDSGVFTGSNSPVSNHVRVNSYGGSSGYDSISSNGGALPKLQKVFFFNIVSTHKGRVGVMVFNTTFNNISVVSLWSVLLVEETGVPGENHRPIASHWQTLSHTVVLITPLHEQDSNSQLPYNHDHDGPSTRRKMTIFSIYIS